MRRLAGFDGAKNINPQWARDGSVYFIANRDGIANIYRTIPATGETRQVTNLATGVSGITAESPALSVAADADRLVFSAVEGGDDNIYGIGEERMAGGPLVNRHTAP